MTIVTWPQITWPHLNSIPPLSNWRKMRAVQAIPDIIRRYPLVSVLSSLSINPGDLHWPSQVNLQPLVVIFVAGTPGPHQPTSASAVKSRQPRGVVPVPRRRGCHGGVLDTAILDSDRQIAEILCKQKLLASTTHANICRTRTPSGSRVVIAYARG